MQGDEILKAELKQAVAECERLREENARLRIRLSASDFDEASDPWIFPPSGWLALKTITEPLPATVSISLGNLIYVEKKDLPDAFLDLLLRLAAFQNPEFYKTQAMRPEGGFAYGVTWEEWERLDQKGSINPEADISMTADGEPQDIPF